MRNWVFGLLSVVVALMTHQVIVNAQETAKTHSYTLENALFAYQDELEVRNYYLACALKADEEGYAGAASLFRAVAESESVHAKNHLRMIKKLGGSPKEIKKEISIGTTVENLKKAISGELYEWQKMYPTFVKQAQNENIMEPVRTYTYAKNSENQHAILFKKAFENLENYKKSDRIFYVCEMCGYTAETLPDKNCPSCKASLDHFRKVQ